MGQCFPKKFIFISQLFPAIDVNNVVQKPPAVKCISPF